MEKRKLRNHNIKPSEKEPAGSWIKFKKFEYNAQADWYPAQVEGATELMIYLDMGLRPGPINGVDMTVPLGPPPEITGKNDPSTGEIMNPPNHCPSLVQE